MTGAGHDPNVGRLEARLLDAAGRCVLDLRPGPNDVRHLSPGVYFVREGHPGPPARVIIVR